MSVLRAAIDRMDALASAGLAKPPTTQPELQRQLAKLDASIGEAEPVVELKPFLRSAAENGAGALPRFQLNRVLRGAWCDPEFDELGTAALDRAVEEQRRSSDQAMIDGYLTYFPVDRPIMGKLADAASSAAQRHEWAWRERARQWELFAPSQGPTRVAQDLLARDDDQVFQLMREVGLGANLAASGFGQETFARFCVATAELPPREAVPAARRPYFLKKLSASVRTLFLPLMASHTRAISASSSSMYSPSASMDISSRFFGAGFCFWGSRSSVSIVHPPCIV